MKSLPNKVDETKQTNDLIVTQPAIGNIDAYINWVKQIPLLSAEEELELAKKLHDQGDLEAARKLVLAHLRFVVYIAKGYLGYGLSKADLIQEGTVGLMKAVKKFNPEFQVRLVSFAVYWIRAEIHDFILRNWRIVKVATTKAQRKLFFNLRRASKKLNWFSEQEISEIASKLNVNPKEVRIMENRLNNHDLTFDGYDDDEDSESSHRNPAYYLTSNIGNPYEEAIKLEFNDKQLTRLTKSLAALDDRSRSIVEKRWLTENKATLHDLASEYHVSAERIRQIEESAIKKLKKELV